MSYLSQSTRTTVSFHTDPRNGFDGTDKAGRHLFRVVGHTFHKSLGDPAGNFTLTLKRAPGAPPLDELWRDPEGVWLKLGMLVNGVPCDVSLCNIDTIQPSVMRGDRGERAETLNIAGRDHGKVFGDTELHINIFEREGSIPMVPLYDALHQSLQGKPHDFVTALIEQWLGNNKLADAQWQLPASLYQGKRFFDILNMTTVSKKTRGDLQDPSLLNPDQQGRKLWDALQEYANGLLNEMWSDLATDPTGRAFAQMDPVTGRALEVRQLSNLRPALYLRERPFPSHELKHAKWDRLITHNIYPEDVKARSLAKGGAANRHNYWLLDPIGLNAKGYELFYKIQEETASVGPDGSGLLNGQPGRVPIYDLDSIRKYGMRRFSQSTRFLPLTDDQDAETAYSISARWLQLIHDWYVVAPLEVSGNITLGRAMPWIRVGHRIREHLRDGRQIVYYVEGVEHKHQFPTPGNTVLTLTRGEPVGRDFLHEVYEHIFSNAHETTGEPDADIEEATDEPEVNDDSQAADPGMNFDGVQPDEDMSDPSNIQKQPYEEDGDLDETVTEPEEVDPSSIIRETDS